MSPRAYRIVRITRLTSGVVAAVSVLGLLGTLTIGPSTGSTGSATPTVLIHLCGTEDGDHTYSESLPSPRSANFVGFAQNDPRWGSAEYANAQTAPLFDIGCGTTLASCGCALSSMATVMALFNLLTLPNGEELNPQTLNSWYTQNATLTAGGWVSLGFAFGNVQWDAVNALSAQMHSQNPDVPRLRFVRRGPGTESEIRSELVQGRPVILDVGPHFIAATGINADNSIRIFDPHYADRVTLDAYAGRVEGSRLFEPLDDTGSAQMVIVTVPSNMRVRVHEEGNEDRAIGTLQNVPIEELQASIEATIPGATFDIESAWRDPSCEASPPKPGQGTIRITLPGDSRYVVEVVDPSGGTPSWGYHAYDEDGNLVDTGAGDGGSVTIDPVEVETPTPRSSPDTPGPAPTDTPDSSLNGSGGIDRSNSPFQTLAVLGTLVAAVGSAATFGMSSYLKIREDRRAQELHELEVARRERELLGDTMSTDDEDHDPTVR